MATPVPAPPTVFRPPTVSLSWVSVIRATTIVLLTLMLISLTGRVSADEHKRLQTAFDESRRQLAEAENDLRTMQAKVSDLEAKIAELNRLLDASGGGTAALRRERALLAHTPPDLRSRYDQLSRLQQAPVLSPEINAALQELAAK